jgi:DMSO/TMAO reductase YedYZ molybdopterin-dependent catalytic subunit
VASYGPDVAPGPLRAAAAGVLAAGAALGTSELLAGLFAGAPSLVVSVADVLVDDAPGGIVRWSIDTFGARQKTLLVGGIVVISLVLGAVLGLVARRRFALAAAGFGAFGILGALAASRNASAWWSWFVAAASVATAVLTLHALLRPPAAARLLDGPEPQSGPAGRRWFLVAGGAAAVWAVTGTSLGARLRRSRNVAEARAALRSRLGGGTPPTVPADVAAFDGAIPGISPLITPNGDFYRIDTALLVPQVAPDGWSLRITGMVDREVELSFDDVLGMERHEEFITLSCVSNEVGGDLVGNAVWSGVLLRDLLARAGPDPTADQIVGRSVDGWTAGFPTATLDDGRPAMVAVTMNGEPLPVRHGFPARLVVPGLYGYVSATKWLTEIELTTLDGFDGYWIPRGWSKEGPIKTQSRIDVPRNRSTIPGGRVAVAGVAWAPTREIDRVEIRVDDGPWQPAELSGALSSSSWVQWAIAWEATPGEHTIEVRATDGTGEVQTEQRTAPAPNGASGHHTIRVTVD